MVAKPHSYNRFLPTEQWKLVSLWDELGIPHENRKQERGAPLTIIGFEVDPNAMTVTMPECLCKRSENWLIR